MSTLIVDAFTDTNGTRLNAHTISPTNTPSTSWTEVVGVWEIGYTVANKVQLVSTSNNETACVCDAGVADVNVSVDFKVDGSGGNAGVSCNYVDDNNHWVCNIESNGNTANIYERTSGTFTNRSTASFTVTPGNTYTVKLTSSGDTITQYVDGTQVNTYTVGSRPHKTGTKCGIKIYGTYATSANTLDNFTVTTLVSSSFTIAPTSIPKNHSGNITLTLTGTGTAWDGTTVFTPSGVTGVTKISQNVTSTTAATVVVTTDATHTGTLTITESVTGSNTATTTVATATLVISPTSGGTGTTPTLTLTGTNTVWTQETAAGLFTESGGTSDSIGTPTITTNLAGTVVLTTGSAFATLTITDASTGATATFNVARVTPADYFVDSASGNNSNAGTSSGAAWLTMGKANTGPAGGYIAGDTLSFKGGQTITGNLVWSTSGTQTARCVIGSYGSGQATISCGDGAGVQVLDAEFVTVQNLTITGSGVNSSTGATTSTAYGLWAYDDRTSGSKLRSVYFTGCTVSGCKGGILFSTPHPPGQSPVSVVGYANMRITNCTIHDCQTVGIYTVGGVTAAGIGDWTTALGTFLGLYVGGCTIYNIFGASGLTGSAVGVINCIGATIERTVAYALSGAASGAGDTSTLYGGYTSGLLIQYCEVYHTFGGAAIDFDNNCQASVAQHNYTHENDGAGLMDFTGSGAARSTPNVFRFNVSRNDCLKTSEEGSIYSTSGSGVFHNNTVISDKNLITGAAVLVSTTGSNVFYNNILIARNGLTVVTIDSGTPTFVGNLYYAPGGTLNLNGDATLSAWQGHGYETQSGILYGVVGDPLLSSPTSGADTGTLPSAQVGTLTYFDIAGGSPGRGAGMPPELVALNPGPVDFHGYPYRTGATVDIGAVAYGASSLVPGFGSGGSGGGGSIFSSSIIQGAGLL